MMPPQVLEEKGAVVLRVKGDESWEGSLDACKEVIGGEFLSRTSLLILVGHPNGTIPTLSVQGFPCSIILR
jgi:hypothetical protein